MVLLYKKADRYCDLLLKPTNDWYPKIPHSRTRGKSKKSCTSRLFSRSTSWSLTNQRPISTRTKTEKAPDFWWLSPKSRTFSCAKCGGWCGIRTHVPVGKRFSRFLQRFGFTDFSRNMVDLELWWKPSVYKAFCRFWPPRYSNRLYFLHFNDSRTLSVSLKRF